MSVGWIIPRNRSLIRSVAERLGLQPPKPQVGFSSALPEVDVEALLKMPLRVSLYYPCPANGNVTTAELVILVGLAQKTVTSAAFEIGTFDGRTALNLAANLPGTARVYTLDLPATDLKHTQFALEEADVQFVTKDHIGRLFEGHDMADRIVQLLGDSASFDFASFYGRMDMVFVDGSHAHDYVVNDTREALRLVKPGGVIVWHDYGVWQGVTRALDELHFSEPELESMIHIRDTSLAIATIPTTTRAATNKDATEYRQADQREV